MDRRTFHALLAASLAVAAASSIAAEPAGDTLRARFDFAPGLQATTVRVAFAPEAWSTADGAPATAARLRDLLARLDRIEVGGRCAGWAEGATSYPCGYAVTLPGQPAALHALGWEIGAEVRERSAALATPELRASGLIAPLPDVPRFVAVRLPKSVVRTGGVLELTIRPLTNRLVPSIFEPASGEVVLHAAPARPGSPA